jgi:hypothetical protein
MLFWQVKLKQKTRTWCVFSNRIDSLADNNDARKLRGDIYYGNWRVQNEIFQLDNIQFYQYEKR